jgi:hypothetical protein
LGKEVAIIRRILWLMIVVLITLVAMLTVMAGSAAAVEHGAYL